ncbi:Rieske 2Fe-2S domain-containing protein, partial [Burkholderia pseudomallei]
LSEGFGENGCVECPLHQGLLDLRTGAPKCAPVTQPVRAYPIRIVDGQGEIHVDG